MRIPLLPFALSLTLVGPASAARSADWPEWHGPGRKRQSLTGLAATLPSELKTVWKVAVLPGHAGPVVAGDRLICLEGDKTSEVARCLDAATGAELWRTAYAPVYEDEWGPGPRCTPFVDGDRVYVQSARGEFRCLSLADGRVLWGMSFEQDYGVAFVGPQAADGGARKRGHAGSGIIEGETVIVPVGSTNATLVACDKRTGQVLWRAGREETGYSSLVIDTLAGTRQLLAFTADALLGVDPAKGTLLWRVPFKTSARRHAATPVVAGDLVVVNSWTFGLAAVRVEKEGLGLKASVAWINPKLKVNVSTTTLAGGHLYSQGPQRDFICVDAATGQLRWSQAGFGSGRRDYASVITDGRRLLALTEDGTLLLLEANPEKYVELGRVQVCGSTWAFPALVGRRLYVRDSRQLSCLELP